MKYKLEFNDLDQIINSKEYSKLLNLTVKKQDNLFVIRYVKSKLNYNNYDTLFKFRSVITDGKSVFSVAPTKSQNLNEFQNSYKFNDCIVEEFFGRDDD